MSSTSDAIAARVRGEYREMPGLRLTLAQACRLWQMERETCEAVLQRLVEDRFLHRTADGAFVALPTPSAPLKATSMPPIHRRSA